MASPARHSCDIQIEMGQEFEECLEFSWKVVDIDGKRVDLRKCVVEMVIDRSNGILSAPAKDATVKRVEYGNEQAASLQNMPEGRKFFIAVVGEVDGLPVRSPWVRGQTLDPKTRDAHLGNMDPMDRPRLNCKRCPCMSYIAERWSQFSGGNKLRCRRCGCRYDSHVAVEISDILRSREDKAKKQLKRPVTFLPKEAIHWDERECMLWFLTEGRFHPRQTVAEGRNKGGDIEAVEYGGPEGLDGRKGRVSVVSPTTESRHKFHEQLWRCFQSQSWPDKELVIVETYQDSCSSFFQSLAEKDERLVYLKYKRGRSEDWSIGLKRNIGAHVATGEYIANFDDDDLYAPEYLGTMVNQLELRKAQAITLSSWFIFDMKSTRWSFCDTIAWGLAQGLDESAPDVKAWAFGYGFSYLNRRRASLETPYEDRDMGEDYNFIQRVQAQRGDKSVQLYHDDCGICVHVQHGGNTSNTFPIREVSKEEAADLDVAELARATVDMQLRKSGPKPRKKMLVAHTELGTYHVDIEVGCTVECFLETLECEMGCGCGDMKVHLVPPPRLAQEKDREEMAAHVLGVVPLMLKLALTHPNLHSEAVVAQRRKLMLERVKMAMRSTDRIPLLTNEVWVVDVGSAEAEAPCVKAIKLDDALEYPDEPMMLVEVEIPATSAKSIGRHQRSFTVMLPEGSTIGLLRTTVGKDMPPTARLLTPGREYALQDSEVAPLKLSVTEFKGKRTFYVQFSRTQCLNNFEMLKVFMLRPESQKKLDNFTREANGNEGNFRVNLSQLLMNEAYPAVFRHYGVELDGVQSVWAVMGGMSVVETLAATGDMAILERHMEVEKLMRNHPTLRYLQARLQSFQRQQESAKK